MQVNEEQNSSSESEVSPLPASGALIHVALNTDDNHRTLNILRREGGSLSLYYTWANQSVHGVLYDTLDVPRSKNREIETTMDQLTITHHLLEELLRDYRTNS